MKIAVIGTGYVGLSNAIILAQHNEVTAVDIDRHKIDLINAGKSPIQDDDIAEYLRDKNLSLQATTDMQTACESAEFVIIATPTNFDTQTMHFDTSSVEAVMAKALDYCHDSTIIIKSTIPVGFVEEQRKKFGTRRIIFSPEFLREGRALYDNLHPSRIIIGDKSEKAKQYAELLTAAAIKKDVPVLFTNPSEAESVKLFANAYLAMRVAFFNELDTYAEIHGLHTGEIIKGISLDPRIGDYYNNPSFGYGGYCLPKDTKQLLANFENVPSDLIGAIVEANSTRIQHIADTLLSRKPRTVGIYRLTMKAGSDNFRQSAIRGVISHLLDAEVHILIYEPSITDQQFEGLDVVSDLDDFKRRANVIVANRHSDTLSDVAHKVYSRDIFNRD